jgi:hypothetical protein
MASIAERTTAHVTPLVSWSSRVTSRAKRLLPVLGVLALVGVCGCGSSSRHGAGIPYGGAFVGSGQTAAGTVFRAVVKRQASAGVTHQESSECPLNVEITETSRKWHVTACYSRLESPVEAHVECVGGILAVHAQLNSATRWVRLNLSNQRQVTSPTISIPRSLGGPANIYYQALRGPSPIPVSLTELDAQGHVLGVMQSQRVVECTPKLVHYNPARARTLTKVRAPNGDALIFTYQPYRILGTSGYGLKVELSGRESRVVGAGALRIAMPLEWEVKRKCGSDAYTLVYGILSSPDGQVFVRANGLHPLQKVVIPAGVQPRGTFVYGFEKASPSMLIVRKSDGTMVVDQNIERIVAATPCS